MPRHSRKALERMLPVAESHVAQGAERIRAQESRLAALEQKGARTEEAEQLLAIMKQTQVLQVEHVVLLRRELAGLE